jgi:hypothetical protein
LQFYELNSLASVIASECSELDPTYQPSDRLSQLVQAGTAQLEVVAAQEQEISNHEKGSFS